MSLETQLFFLNKRTQISLDLIAKINQENPESRLIVVDVSSYHYPVQPPWRVTGPLISRSNKVLGLFHALGVEYIDAARLQPVQIDFTSEESVKMDIAIRGNIMSSYARGLRTRTRRSLIEVYLDRRLRWQSRKIFSLATELIKKFSASEVFVENGRFAAPHATYLAALKKGAKPLFYEAFPLTNTAAILDYRVHDRIERQRRALEATSMLQDSAIKAHAKDALAKIRGGRGFDSLWPESENEWKGQRDSLALFATSSSDETYSVDLDWNEASWGSQYEAFQAIWGKLKLRNLTPVLRIHPNLLNKSPSAAHREIKEIRRFQRENPEFYIVWPAMSVSTYDLISYSDVVVVENSTVGLEASAEGIPVICSNSCHYDMVADVVKVHGPEDLDKIDNVSKTSDPRGAERFLAFTELTSRLVPRNEFGVSLHGLSRVWMLVPSLINGSIFSAVFELRWKIYRFIMLKTSPRR